MTCPAGFEMGAYNNCIASCPPEFKLVREWGGADGMRERCVSLLRNNRSYNLLPLQPPYPDTPVPPMFEQELARVRGEATKIRGQVEEDIRKTRIANDAADGKRPQVNEFSRIQSEYAAFRQVSAAADQVRATKDSLRVFRPPTAPSSDLEQERRAITDIAKQNMFFIQAVLLIVLLALLGYVVLPVEWAHGIAFLLLTTAISIGFFLRR